MRFLSGLVTMVMLMVAVPSFAALQYGYGIDIEKTAGLPVKGISTNKGWHVEVVQDCTLSFNSNKDMLAAFNGHMKKVMAAYGNTYIPTYTNVGYFTFDMDSKAVLSMETLNFVDDIATTQTLYAGETVGFWMEIDGVLYSSVLGVNGFVYQNKVFGGGDGAGIQKLYNYGTSTEGYQLSLFMGIGDPIPAPSGQPLPGVVAALLFGGAGIAAKKLRNRKK